jgi:hypothetical protein
VWFHQGPTSGVPALLKLWERMTSEDQASAATMQDPWRMMPAGFLSTGPHLSLVRTGQLPTLSLVPSNTLRVHGHLVFRAWSLQPVSSSHCWTLV